MGGDKEAEHVDRSVSFLVLPLICKATGRSYSNFPLLWFIIFVLQYSHHSHSNKLVYVL